MHLNGVGTVQGVIRAGINDVPGDPVRGSFNSDKRGVSLMLQTCQCGVGLVPRLQGVDLQQKFPGKLDGMCSDSTVPISLSSRQAVLNNLPRCRRVRRSAAGNGGSNCLRHDRPDNRFRTPRGSEDRGRRRQTIATGSHSAPPDPEAKSREQSQGHKRGQGDDPLPDSEDRGAGALFFPPYATGCPRYHT